MPAYTRSGGPCHWDLELCIYIAIGARYARNQGALGANNRLNEARVTSLTRDLIRQAERSFHRIFNIDVRFRPFPWGLSGTRTREEIRDALPEGCGVVLAEDLSIADHPHTDGGGRVVIVGVDDVSSHTLPHEIGHMLGLPDMYSHPAVPELNVPELQLPPDVEEANRGRLMGKPRNGRRDLHQDEIEAIARLTGMTCDPAVCCKGARQEDKEEPKEKVFPPPKDAQKPGCVRFAPLGGILDLPMNRHRR